MCGELTNRKKCINAMTLRWLALGLMLLDHIWLNLCKPDQVWLTCLGRLAFPIFAFQIAEGCVHTSNLKRYALRLAAFALLSEVPYDYMKTCRLVDFNYQNVMFTLLAGLLILRLLLWAKERSVLYRLGAVLAFGAVYLAADVFGFSYGGLGVCTVVMFGLTRSLPRRALVQTICLLLINVFISGWMLSVGTLQISCQLLAVFAMIPICMYNAERGSYSKFLQYSAYFFYPAHIAVLVTIRYLVNRYG